MKVSIYEENPEVKEEQEFFLNMEKVKHGIEVFLVNTEGQKLLQGVVLRINNDMTLYRYKYINTDIGLPLDGMNRLELGDGN